MNINRLFNSKDILSKLNRYPLLTAFCIGFLSIFAFAPYFVWPILIPLLCLLLHLTFKTQSGATAFLIGFFYYLGIITSHFSWGITLTRQFFETSHSNIFMIYGLSLTAIILFFAISLFLYGTFFLLFRALVHKIYKAFIPLCFCITLFVSEVIEGYPYAYGFPWHLSGYAVANNLYLIQLASVGSIYLITFLFILFCCLFYPIFKKPFWVLPAVILFILWFGFGYLRISNAPTEDPKSQTNIRLVQANIDAKTKQSERGKLNSFLAYLNITSDPHDKPLDLIIWPETAVPYIINEHPAALQQITKRATTDILTGAIWREEDAIYNSSVLIKSEGFNKNRADKTILVPYGEYWPIPYFRNVFESILPGRINFKRASQAPLIKTSNAGTALILSCYENIFPLYAGKLASKADFTVHMTNEAWFTNHSTVREQNFYISRLRAIETGLPIIRATNFGYNSVIDGYGRIIYTNLSQFPEAQDVYLPQKNTQPTSWVKLFDIFFN